MWEILFWLFILFLFLRWIGSKLNEPRVRSHSSKCSVWEKPFEIKIPRGEDDVPKSHWERLGTPLLDSGYVDDNGYMRDGYGRLIHRKVAFEYNYKNGNYSKKFWEYDVHHKDRNKKNNSPGNIQILTREEHKAKHGLK